MTTPIEPGYFEVRLVRRGPWIAARISTEREFFCVEIDGQRVGGFYPVQSVEERFADLLAADGDPYRDPLLQVLLFGRRIDEAAYYYRLTLGRWARIAMPDHPAAHPRKRIDLRSVPVNAVI